MAKLILIRDGESQIEYELEAQETIVGRTQDCDITISDDAVSRRHMRIICILGDCFLEDLNSANGTMVNNRLTKKCPLEDGDVIIIGRHEIKYVAAAQDNADGEEDYDKTRIFLMKQLGDADSIGTTAEDKELDSTVTGVNGGDSSEANSEPAPIEIPEPKPSTSRTRAEIPNDRCGKLTLISGKKRGQEMSLIKDVTGIGRSGKRIAAITRRPNGYFLVPLEVDKSNHSVVKVNGEEISRKIYPLCSNDIIELGKTMMEFSFMDSDPTK